MSFHSIIDFYNRLSPIEEAEWELFSKLTTQKTLKKNESFLVHGQIPTEFGIILSGVVRHYYLDKEGREWTKSFNSKNELIGPHAEFLQNVPARTCIQAVIDSEILVVPYADFVQLTANKLQWEVLSKKITEKLYLDKENREYQFLTKDAEERYNHFLSQYAEISNFISDYQIASFIGITPQALSRIRNKRSFLNPR